MKKTTGIRQEASRGTTKDPGEDGTDYQGMQTNIGCLVPRNGTLGTFSGFLRGLVGVEWPSPVAPKLVPQGMNMKKHGRYRRVDANCQSFPTVCHKTSKPKEELAFDTRDG